MVSLLTLYRWFRRITPESRSTEAYLSRDRLLVVGVSAGAILFLLIATHLIGIYAALFLFLLFYLRFVGRHSWALTSVLTVALPVFIFACLNGRSKYRCRSRSPSRGSTRSTT